MWSIDFPFHLNAGEVCGESAAFKLLPCSKWKQEHMWTTLYVITLDLDIHKTPEKTADAAISSATRNKRTRLNQNTNNCCIVSWNLQTPVSHHVLYTIIQWFHWVQHKATPVFQSFSYYAFWPLSPTIKMSDSNLRSKRFPSRLNISAITHWWHISCSKQNYWTMWSWS